MGVFGKPLPLDTVLRMRIFDTWVHEQDVRVAADRPGGLSGPPAWISAASMVNGAAFVWARRVAAAEGSAAALIVTGPGLHFDIQVGIVDGRGVIVTEAEPVTTLTLPFPELVAPVRRSGTGRQWPGAGDDHRRSRAGRIAGDPVERLALSGSRTRLRHVADGDFLPRGSPACHTRSKRPRVAREGSE